LAPGKPSGASVSAEGTQDSKSAEARESYRIFKEQFNFDKPVMWNTRFLLSKEDVHEEVQVLADFARPTCTAPNTPQDCLDADAKPGSGRVIEAQDTIEDWGTYVVPQLLDIGTTDPRLDIRRIAINRLSVNAKRRLVNEYGKNQTDEQRQYNREVAAENERVSGWTLSDDATLADVDALIAASWKPWYDQNKSRWEWSFGDKTSIFLFDTRFAKYWGNLARFDFGVSHIDKRPVLDKIMERMPYTLTLNFLAIFFAYLISIPIGVWSAYRQNSTADRVVTAVLFALYSLPSFFVGVLLLNWLADGDPIGVFPTGGFVGKLPDWVGIERDSTADMTVLEYILSASYHMVLPVFCMTYGGIASLSRYARTGLLDTIRADFIRTARAKGLSETMVVIKHAIRNGMIPVLTLLGTMLPALIGGSVVIEYVFNIPGMGLFMFESIFARDYNAIMGVLLISTVLTLVGLLLSDISYAIVDPRISFD
ncbi:MAG: ABC transporter permease, partial [bacterium]